MVNTHHKFPVDAKHNAYYAADGSDLREATDEEITKYQLAAAHKRKKPDADVTTDRSGGTTVVIPEAKRDDDRTSQRDADRHRKGSPRGVVRKRDSHNREAQGKGGRTSSRDSRSDKDGTHREHSRTDSKRRDGGGATGNRPSEREEKKRDTSEEIDEDERDRRQMADIQRGMEERKIAKELERARAIAKDLKTATTATALKTTKESRKGGGGTKEAKRRVTERACPPKKVSGVQTGATKTADVEQRESAMQWATGISSDTALVTQSTVPTRQKAAKKVTEKQRQTATEPTQDMDVQDFMSAQYPPVDEGVSSTVRLGRSFVSGALGRRIEDPKMLEAAVIVTDCSVVIQSTKRKAKVPVSAPPPNSIDSEVEMEEGNDTQLSQSATDVDVQIELPEGETETMIPAKGSVTGVSHMEGDVRGVPVAPGVVQTPKATMADGEPCATTVIEGEKRNPVAEETPKDTPTGVMENERSVEERRMIKEIDASVLLQQKMMRNDPLLSSASSFLSVVCGGEGRNSTGKDKAGKSVKATETVPRILPIVEAVQPSLRVVEKQRAIRIIAAESLLREELAKIKPVLASVAAFRKAAYGKKCLGDNSQGIGSITAGEETLVAATDVVTEHATTAMIQTPTPGAEGDNAGAGENIDLTEGEEIVVSEEEEMSVSESGEEGKEESDGFSRSDGGSSVSESVTSRGNRKRYAVESPEREPAGTTRKVSG